ncbi:septal ring lytic transglycosylase RlpA family protein [Pusillimonas sp. TS35]|uniref:septal ring lytic transglycosylase RlpA family protein n=1 Tax=Paracandidimonas lactea TaxID=2895524 RepID=UPI00136DAF67|nr:septal ring lytic transglycosylase RlpA family protein [Paracandidimonas lactea]MYN12981.1 septal ring lytic transglycosylase RlpA family protein [Pusillimonas sp. TS35]
MIRPHPLLKLATLVCVAALAACSGPGGTKKSASSGSASSASRGGGYYLDDGPGSNIPADLDAIPDAIPRVEKHAAGNFKPYTAMGKRYVPIKDNSAFREVGTASWYGRKFHGRKTANGEVYDMYAMTAAHPTLPLPSYARVTRAGTGKSVIVRINDRGPFHSSRIIDLSYVAASRLGLIGAGSGKVIVEAITNDEIREGKQAPDIVPDLPQPEARLVAKAAPKAAPAPSLQVRTVSPDGRVAAGQTYKAGDPVPDALQALALAGAGQPRASRSTPSRVDTMPTPNSALARADAIAPDSGGQAIERHTTPSGTIFLQFGAFSAHETANKLALKLNTRINDVERRQAHVQPSGGLYRVRIGPYASRTEAVNAANRIQEATGMNPSVALR